jgi:hypothetical protein
MSRFTDTYPGALIDLYPSFLATGSTKSGHVFGFQDTCPANTIYIMPFEHVSRHPKSCPSFLFLFYRKSMTCVCLSACVSRKLTCIWLFWHFRQNDHVMHLSGLSCIWTTRYVSVSFYYCCLYVLPFFEQSFYLSRHTVLYLPFYKFVWSLIGQSCYVSWHTVLYFIFF